MNRDGVTRMDDKRRRHMLKIGIILGSTREGRVSPQVGTWVKEVAEKRRDAEYEIIDIAEFKLPF